MDCLTEKAAVETSLTTATCGNPFCLPGQAWALSAILQAYVFTAWTSRSATRAPAEDADCSIWPHQAAVCTCQLRPVFRIHRQDPPCLSAPLATACLPLSLPGFSVSMQRRHHCHPEQAVVHGPAHDSRPSSARQQRMENEVCACLSVQSRDSSHGWCPLTMDIALTSVEIELRTDGDLLWKHFNALINCSVLHLLTARLRRDRPVTSGLAESLQDYIWSCQSLRIFLFILTLHGLSSPTHIQHLLHEQCLACDFACHPVPSAVIRGCSGPTSWHPLSTQPAEGIMSPIFSDASSLHCEHRIFHPSSLIMGNRLLLDTIDACGRNRIASGSRTVLCLLPTAQLHNWIWCQATLI